MITKIEMQQEYSIVVENDPDKEKTTLGVDGWSLMFMSKQSVLDHIEGLQKALEFWEYDDKEKTND